MFLYPIVTITTENREIKKPILGKYVTIIDPAVFSAAVLKDIYPSANPQFFYEALASGLISPLQLVPSLSVETIQVLNTRFDLVYEYLLGYTKSKGPKLLKTNIVWLELYNMLAEFIQTGWKMIRSNKYQIITDVRATLPKINNPNIELYTIRIDIVLTYKKLNILLNYEEFNDEQTLYDIILGMQTVYNTLDKVSLGLLVSIGSFSINLQNDESKEIDFEPLVVLDPIELDLPSNQRMLYKYLSYTPKVFLANLFAAGASMLNDKITKEIMLSRKKLKFKL